LEAVLGLDRFDPALQACRDALSALRAQRAPLTNAQARAEGALSTLADSEKVAVAQVERLSQVPAEDLSALDALVARLRVMVEDARRDLRALTDQRAAVGGDVVARRALLRDAEARHAKLASGTCPTCGSPVHAEHLGRLLESIEATRQDVATLSAAADRTQAELDALRDEAQKELNTLRAKLDDTLRRIERAKAAAVQLKDAQAELARVGTLRAKATAEWEAATQKLADLDHDIAIHEAAAEVLGLRGVRAQVLSHALAGVEAVANVWLARIAGPDLRLTLRPYSEKADGGTSDAIGLEVHGAGGGYGYRAASGGERRRIDVALLLALAEVSSHAMDVHGGTIWADEVFDALDADGVEAVAHALDTLARERAVVVITHNPALRAKLTPVTTVHLTKEP
jgi:DNA repair exonuclease SbcCD ATPase subunit